MAKINLSKYGITGATEIVHNPSYEMLFDEETKTELEGYEKGQVSELGAVNVMTGVYTGRSPKDKFIVMQMTTPKTPFGGLPTSIRTTTTRQAREAWECRLRTWLSKSFQTRRLFVVDAFCGANEDTRMAIRFHR